MRKQINLTKEKCDTFKGIIILNSMINHKINFNINDKQNICLNDLFELLSDKELIEIKGDLFVPTQNGRNNLLSFYRKFWEFTRMFQIYSAVDLENGFFAYSNYWNVSQDEFDNYLNSKEWDDVRIAVAEFKGIDPVEIVFMSFLDSNRFGIDNPNWKKELVGDKIWNEIVEICSTAIHKEELEADDVIVNIISEGSKLLVDLCKQEDNQRKQLDYEEQELEDQNSTEIIEEFHNYSYYEPYLYDPFYISPIWGLIII